MLSQTFEKAKGAARVVLESSLVRNASGLAHTVAGVMAAEMGVVSAGWVSGHQVGGFEFLGLTVGTMMALSVLGFIEHVRREGKMAREVMENARGMMSNERINQLLDEARAKMDIGPIENLHKMVKASFGRYSFSTYALTTLPLVVMGYTKGIDPNWAKGVQAGAVPFFVWAGGAVVAMTSTIVREHLREGRELAKQEEEKAIEPQKPSV